MKWIDWFQTANGKGHFPCSIRMLPFEVSSSSRGPPPLIVPLRVLFFLLVLSIWTSISSRRSRENVSYFGGIASHHVLRMVEPLSRGDAVEWHSLGLELSPLTLAAARDRGLSDRRARRLERHDPEGRRVLSVRRRAVGLPGARLFREGDLILSIDGDPVTRARDLRRATHKGRFVIEILRDGQENKIEVEPEKMSGEGTTRAVLWSGALLQAPHRELAAQRGLTLGGVYVSFFNFGSPASRSGLFAGRRIVAVDGNPTTDLDQFVTAVSGLNDGESVRLNTVSWNNVPEVITLKLDEQYWPSYELRRSDRDWSRGPLYE